MVAFFHSSFCDVFAARGGGRARADVVLEVESVFVVLDVLVVEVLRWVPNSCSSSPELLLGAALDIIWRCSPGGTSDIRADAEDATDDVRDTALFSELVFFTTWSKFCCAWTLFRRCWYLLSCFPDDVFAAFMRWRLVPPSFCVSSGRGVSSAEGEDEFKVEETLAQGTRGVIGDALCAIIFARLEAADTAEDIDAPEV
eukprot:g7991.t1